jgi:hypothetical protein
MLCMNRGCTIRLFTAEEDKHLNRIDNLILQPLWIQWTLMKNRRTLYQIQINLAYLTSVRYNLSNDC